MSRRIEDLLKAMLISIIKQSYNVLSSIELIFNTRSFTPSKIKSKAKDGIHAISINLYRLPAMNNNRQRLSTSISRFKQPRKKPIHQQHLVNRLSRAASHSNKWFNNLSCRKPAATET